MGIWTLMNYLMTVRKSYKVFQPWYFCYFFLSYDFKKYLLETHIKVFTNGDFSGGPVVKILHIPCMRAQVWSLIGELRSHMPCDMAYTHTHTYIHTNVIIWSWICITTVQWGSWICIYMKQDISWSWTNCWISLYYFQYFIIAFLKTALWGITSISKICQLWVYNLM